MLIRTLILTLVATTTVSAQPHWEYAGPWGDAINNILVMPDGDLIADAQTGLFISSDKGESWAPSGATTPWKIGLGAVSPLSGTIVGMTYIEKIYSYRPVYSTDKGRTWDTASMKFDGIYFTRFFCSANGIFYVGGNSGWGGAPSGVLRSTDDGRSWEQIGMERYNIADVVTLDDSTLITSTDGWADIGEPAMDWSTDGGRTWERIMRTRRSINAFAIDSSGGIWGIMNNVAWRSTDNGRTWDSAGPSTNRGFSTIAVAHDGSVILTSRVGPLWKSIDNGATWDSLPVAVSRFEPVVMVTFSSSEILIGNVSAAGIIRSTDSGRSWSERHHAIPSSIRSVCTGGGRLLIKAHEIKFSNDKGASWQKPPTEYGSSLPAIGISDAGTYLLKESNHIDRSTDGGLTWSRDSQYVPFNTFASNGAGDLFGLGGSDSLIFISNDDGLSWTSVPFPVEHVGVDAAFEGRSAAYISSPGNGIRRSLDNGATWTQILPGYVQALTVDQTGRLIVLSGDPLLRSEDRGATWQILADTSIRFNSLVTAPDGSILGSTVDSGIWKSSDGGESWLPISDGLDDLNITQITIDRMTGDIYAATEHAGLFRLAGPLSSVRSVKNGTRINADRADLR